MCYFWWVAFCPEQEGGVVQLRAAQFLCLMGVCVAGDGGDQWCCSVGSSLKWHSPRDVELHSQGGTLGCFPSSSAALLQDSGSVKQTWVGFFPSVLCFFNKWFIALQHTRGSEGPVPLERAVLCAAAGCSLMDPCYAQTPQRGLGNNSWGFTVSIQAWNTQKSITCVSTLLYHHYQIDPQAEDLTWDMSMSKISLKPGLIEHLLSPRPDSCPCWFGHSHSSTNLCLVCSLRSVSVSQVWALSVLDRPKYICNMKGCVWISCKRVFLHLSLCCSVSQLIWLGGSEWVGTS